MRSRGGNELLDTSRGGCPAAVGVSGYSFTLLVRHFGPLTKPGGSFLALSYMASERVVPASPSRLLAAESPELAAGLEDLLVHDELVGAFGLGDRLKLCRVRRRSIAKTDGARVVWLQQLNLKLTTIPARLRLVVVRVNHRATIRPGSHARA
ncbi:MAG: SDR family oxidoreductase, partial [Deltaproteobacteria bacterium]|nr:SDR family oxidoreductase [Deltaproteobacteria bacterium]